MKPLVADLHMHTLVSGHAFGTIREMAADAALKNLQLIGITEHGPGIPGTCDPIYFLNFGDAPRNLYGVELLYGCEANVLPGGKLSLGRRYLDALDYAIAGIHGFCYEDEGIVGNTQRIVLFDSYRIRAHVKYIYGSFVFDMELIDPVSGEWVLAESEVYDTREEALAAVDTKLGNAPVNEDKLFN